MKIFKHLGLLLLLTAMLPLVSCTKKTDAAALSVSSAQENFTADGGTKEVSVTCTSQWSVSDTSWWCLSKGEPSQGNGKITILIQPNVSSLERTTILSVSSGNNLKEIKVVQAGKTVSVPINTDPPDSIAPDQAGMRNLNSVDLAKEMKIGWNIGNSLEATGGETAWGNPKITQTLIDSIKKAGFNAIRIPVAWSKFTDAATFRIDTAWLGRVEQVVNYVLKNNMYAIINNHWDGGWMQPTNAKKDYVNGRLAAIWRQVAIRFRNYDDHLLFAGSNEVMVEGNYNTPTVEYYTVQNSFNQTFVSAVRATGGRNAYRHLIVQGFNTNIDHTVNFFVAPVDRVEKRLMVEVHYYDPYDFTLNTTSTITQWGKNATDPAKTETWANEAYADGQFQKMKLKFIDNGYAVILGEYGAIARLNLGSAALNADHAAYRKYYMEYITKSIVSHGLIPFYWDSGFTGDNGMGIFDRASGGRAYPGIVAAIVSP
ncbi:MAG TPA: cellulase family glycosylhydrolase [Chitinophagaceae bacterium]|nr:cellulase family glycosylhydrolase [Chitinophagaceae bacterium]